MCSWPFSRALSPQPERSFHVVLWSLAEVLAAAGAGRQAGRGRRGLLPHVLCTEDPLQMSCILGAVHRLALRYMHDRGVPDARNPIPILEPQSILVSVLEIGQIYGRADMPTASIKSGKIYGREDMPDASIKSAYPSQAGSLAAATPLLSHRFWSLAGVPAAAGARRQAGRGRRGPLPQVLRTKDSLQTFCARCACHHLASHCERRQLATLHWNTHAIAQERIT